jgi:drug/metabolite transporter (DMT)-like permease
VYSGEAVNLTDKTDSQTENTETPRYKNNKTDMPTLTPHAPAVSEPRTWLGIILIIAAVSTLSMLDSVNKILAIAGYHVVMIAWIRYSGNALLMAFTMVPMYQRRTGKSIFRTRNIKLQFMRGCILLLSTLIFFSMLRIMPIAEATSLNFCAPLIVLAVSPWVLKEPSRISRWIAVIVGFIGMLIVVRPGGDIPPLGVLLGACSACAFATFSILNKKLAKVDDPVVTLFYGAVIGMVLSSIAVPFFWSVHSPSMLEWLLIISMGVTSTLGHFLMNCAYKNAEASMLMPFTYMQIIAAATLGWLLFDQFPDGFTLLGILIICSSGAGIACFEYYLTHKRRRAARLIK